MHHGIKHVIYKETLKTRAEVTLRGCLGCISGVSIDRNFRLLLKGDCKTSMGLKGRICKHKKTLIVGNTATNRFSSSGKI